MAYVLDPEALSVQWSPVAKATLRRKREEYTPSPDAKRRKCHSYTPAVSDSDPNEEELCSFSMSPSACSVGGMCAFALSPSLVDPDPDLDGTPLELFERSLFENLDQANGDAERSIFNGRGGPAHESAPQSARTVFGMLTGARFGLDLNDLIALQQQEYRDEPPALVVSPSDPLSSLPELSL